METRVRRRNEGTKGRTRKREGRVQDAKRTKCKEN